MTSTVRSNGQSTAVINSPPPAEVRPWNCISRLDRQGRTPPTHGSSHSRPISSGSVSDMMCSRGYKPLRGKWVVRPASTRLGRTTTAPPGQTAEAAAELGGDPPAGTAEPHQSRGRTEPLPGGRPHSVIALHRGLRLPLQPPAGCGSAHPVTLGYEMVSRSGDRSDITQVRVGDLVHTGTPHQEETLLDATEHPLTATHPIRAGLADAVAVQISGRRVH